MFLAADNNCINYIMEFCNRCAYRHTHILQSNECGQHITTRFFPLLFIITNNSLDHAPVQSKSYIWIYILSVCVGPESTFDIVERQTMAIYNWCGLKWSIRAQTFSSPLRHYHMNESTQTLLALFFSSYLLFFWIFSKSYNSLFDNFNKVQTICSLKSQINYFYELNSVLFGFACFSSSN